MFKYTMWMQVHPTHLEMSSATLSNEIFLCSFLIENHDVVFNIVPSTTENCILFRNHKDFKVVGGSHYVLVHYVDAFAPDLSGAVICNPQHRISANMSYFHASQKVVVAFIEIG